MLIEKLGRYLTAVEDPRCSGKVERCLVEVLVSRCAWLSECEDLAGLLHPPMALKESRCGRPVRLAERAQSRGGCSHPPTSRNPLTIAFGTADFDGFSSNPCGVISMFACG